jgi:hypothetical protein
MQYIIRCGNCSGADLVCDELREDHRCPRCQSVPATYEIDGQKYCWLHRQLMSSRYSVSANFLFTIYAWRGHESLFPNAKLFEALNEKDAAGTTTFCTSCQEVYERWLNSFAE